MHIPDGFLSPPVWATLDVASVPAVAWMARRAQRDTDDRKIPLLGVMGAFVFAAQMIQFPVGLGTSGHLVGGALLAVVLGPAAASVVMTAILAIQALVFQDGGVLGMGANVFNMALAGVAAGYLPYKIWGRRWRAQALFLSGFSSVLVSACLALAQLLLSGVRMPARMLSVSIGLFVVSAVIEGAITVAAVGAIERLVPGTVRDPAAGGSRVFATVGLVSVLLAAFGILAASSAPDGIQHLSAQLGLAERVPAWLAAPLAGYQLHTPLVTDAWFRKAAAGLMGLVLIYAACAATGRLLARQKNA